MDKPPGVRDFCLASMRVQLELENGVEQSEQDDPDEDDDEE